MPKRKDIKSILIVGAGPIIIGQACEFDYSGTQACKALREEGYRVILINSNPATIMTDPDTADVVYIEPITPEIVTKIIKKERPDVMPSTYRDYMAYQYAKPEAGSLVTIDPKRGSFTALGGMVRGSAKGLNDPELRIRGFKTTASEIGGLYAGTQAMKATMGFLGKQGSATGDIDTSSFNPNISDAKISASNIIFSTWSSTFSGLIGKNVLLNIFLILWFLLKFGFTLNKILLSSLKLFSS